MAIDDLTDYSFLASTTVERAQEEGGIAETLTLTCTYYESVEKLQNNHPKEIKLWIYRDEAIALAELILRTAGAS